MALTTVLWTINGLATELGISHRGLGRRLSNLAPDEVEQQAGRQVKRWRLARVLKHLKAADRTIVKVDEQLIEDHKYVLALHLALGEFFAGVDAELAGEPLSENIEDHELEVRIPPELRKLGELGPEAYAARPWPAGPA